MPLKVSLTMESVSLVSPKPGSRFADLVVALSSANAPSLEQHPIESIRDAVASERVRSGTAEYA